MSDTESNNEFGNDVLDNSNRVLDGYDSASSVWANFDHFEKLELFLKYNDEQNGLINYNLKNKTQLTVKVRARAVDKNGKILPLTVADLKSVACLCVYESDSSFYQNNGSWKLYQKSDGSDYQPVLTEKLSNQNTYDIYGVGKETGDAECDLYIAPNGTAFDLVNIAVHLDIQGHGRSGTAKGKATGAYPECYISVRGITSVWDVCESISSLAISYAESTNSKSTLYANGRNQAPAKISVSAVDAQGHYLNLMVSDFITEYKKQYSTPRLELINTHNNDDVLVFNGTKGACYTFTANEWNNPVNYASGPRVIASADNGICDIPVYIYSHTASAGKDISVRLNIPDVACITTALTSTGQWSSYASSKVTLTFLAKIDYSDVSKLTIVEKGWSTLCDTVHITYHANNWGGSSHSQSNAVVRSKQVLIKPDVGNSEVKLLNEKTAVLNRTHCAPYNTKEKIGMYGYSSAHSADTYVQSILDYTPEHGGHIVAWGVEVPPDMKKFGFLFTSGHDCQDETNYEPYAYHYMLDINENCGKRSWIVSPARVEGVVTLHALEASHSIDNYCHHLPAWTPKINPVKVTVWDNFGNTGTFQISWDQRTYTPTISG